jgi:hypothetical protein
MGRCLSNMEWTEKDYRELEDTSERAPHMYHNSRLAGNERGGAE